MSKKVDHIGHYISLVLILILGFLLVYYGRGRHDLQMAAVIIITFCYVGWGVFHHLINHTLTAKIVIEYVLVGSLGIAIVFSILKGGVGL